LGEIDDEESIRAIHAGLDAGINFFDTAIQFSLNALNDNPAMRALCEEKNLAGVNKDPLNRGGRTIAQGVLACIWATDSKPAWASPVDCCRALRLRRMQNHLLTIITGQNDDRL
jgi:diketogulonate reductase-like aldo/keto reductase